MRYGQIAGNDSINATIYDCFGLIDERDHRAFVKKFERQRGTEQVMHTYRELTFGALLAKNGLVVRSEPELKGKTPDWGILGEGGELKAILDVLNCNLVANLAQQLEIDLAKKRVGAFWYPEELSSQRLWSNLDEKCAKYRDLIEDLDIPFVIGLFFPLKNPMSYNTMCDVCRDSEANIMQKHPHLSGILLGFEASMHFAPMPSQYATRPFELPPAQSFYGPFAA